MVSSNEDILASAPLLAGMEKASQMWSDTAGGMQLVGTHDFQMTAEVDTCGWWLQALHSGPWSYMHWEAHCLLGPKGYLRPRITRREKKTEQTNYDSERCDYFQPWNDYKKTDLNEWIILMIKEKQIELFSIGLLSSFYLDASLL